MDALRAVAAIAVLVRHLPDFYGPLEVLTPLKAVGHTGVGLFLVLSGFSIHYKWAATRLDHGASFSQRVFWRRRFRRLYPSYAAAALLALVVGLALGELGALRWPLTGDRIDPIVYVSSQVLLVPTNLVPAPLLTPVVWSLGLEIQLYAVYALAIATMRRFDPWRLLMWAAVATLAWRVGVQAIETSTPMGGFLPDGTTSAESRFFYMQMPARCFEWFLGALAAEAYVGRVQLPRAARSLLVAAVLFATAALLYRKPLGGLSLNGNDFRASDVILDPLFGLAFFTALMWATAHEPRLAEHRIAGRGLAALASVGLFSYSLYLVHLPVSEVAREVIPVTGTAGYLGIPALAAVAILGAWGFFLAIERRYLRPAGR